MWSCNSTLTSCSSKNGDADLCCTTNPAIHSASRTVAAEKASKYFCAWDKSLGCFRIEAGKAVKKKYPPQIASLSFAGNTEEWGNLVSVYSDIRALTNMYIGVLITSVQQKWPATKYVIIKLLKHTSSTPKCCYNQNSRARCLSQNRPKTH